MQRADQVEQPSQAQASIREKTALAAKNRGRLDVVADVLSACSRPASKNAVLIKANVNSVTATYMLAQLMDTRLIDTLVDEEGRIAYIATKQGAAYLGAYRNLTDMLSSALVPATRAVKAETDLFLE